MWHGPTGSFKDLALGLLPRLVNFFPEEKGEHATVVVVTSGDTGPAAIHGVLGSDNMHIIVFYPKGRVDRAQELQMSTVDTENVTVYGGEGAICDDGDTIVNRIITDVELSRKHSLLSLNSSNIGRVLIQAVHYFYTYLKACSSVGDVVLMSVPSGSCGNLASGVLAQKMGLPIKFLVGVNHNDTVHECFSTGRLRRRDSVVPSYACAMDIQCPYNMERVVSFFTDDMSVVAEQFNRWDATGMMHLTSSQLMEIQKPLWSISIGQAGILETMQEIMTEYNYHLCPHSAIGVHAAKKFFRSPDAQQRLLPPGASLSSTPVVCYATATLAKFKEVADKAGIGLPSCSSVEALYGLPEKARLLRAGDDWEAIIRQRIEEISAQRMRILHEWTVGL